ncbi:Vitamin B12 import ATP-binding protein BtuD [Streptomyces alboniger]
MRQRALIAMALACEPALLVADEPTTALDVTVQAQILDLLHTLRQETGMGLLLVTHDVGVAAESADEVLVMRDGRAVDLAVGRTWGAPARARAFFHGRLAAEVYRGAALITPGNTHVRRWQERCGADRAKLRTVHPGMAADRFTEIGERGHDDRGRADPATLLWVGCVEPAKDLVSLLHAFAEVRAQKPDARLRIIGAAAGGREAEEYLAHCRALAAQLFPDEADGPHAVGDNPVSFEEIGGPEVPDLADAYAAGGVAVLSSVVEGFPISLVEAEPAARAPPSRRTSARWWRSSAARGSSCPRATRGRSRRRA